MYALPKNFLEIVDVFEKSSDAIDSDNHNLTSNQVLAQVSSGLEKIGYFVEKGKKGSEKIHIPVLFGQNGVEEKSFEADAYNYITHTIIEVEAGRAVLNYQFLKDFYEACMMHDVEYLCIAVRNTYTSGGALSKDYEKVKTYMDTMYLCHRVQIPLKDILIIGY